jgi:hypothetical protein
MVLEAPREWPLEYERASQFRLIEQLKTPELARPPCEFLGSLQRVSLDRRVIAGDRESLDDVEACEDVRRSQHARR